jgi:hypothetical protein
MQALLIGSYDTLFGGLQAMMYAVSAEGMTGW